jgi:hypothetical protein
VAVVEQVVIENLFQILQQVAFLSLHKRIQSLLAVVAQLAQMV